MEILAIYLFLINALGLCLMLIDKRRARKNLWRIPEKTLLTVAAIGGSLGAIWGMRLAHHKTRKPKFSIGLPIIFALQVILLIFSLIYTNTI